MSGKDEKTKEFWEQSAEDLIKTDDEEFKIEVEGYFKKEFVDGLYEEKFLVRAIEEAESAVINLKFKELDIRVASLESANEFSFSSIALNLALSSACGIIVGQLAKELVTKVLSRRMILLNVIDQGTINVKPLTKKNLSEIMKKAGFNSTGKHAGLTVTKLHHRIGREINLKPGSWESLMIEHFPDIMDSRADEFVQALEGGIPKGSYASKIKSPEINAYFNSQQTLLVAKMKRLEISHVDLMMLIKKSLLKSNYTGFTKRGYIGAIKEKNNFKRTNNNTNSYSADVESTLMAQPFILTAITSSFGKIPDTIRGANTISETTFGYETHLKEKVKASPEYIDLLFDMTKYILVPITNGNTPISFFDHYKKDKRKSTVALVRYLNKIREQKSLQELKRWTLEGYELYKNISTGLSLPFLLPLK